MAGSVIHADDTPIPVLVPGNGKTRTRPLVGLSPRRAPARRAGAVRYARSR